jgi:hypothetical protein
MKAKRTKKTKRHSKLLLKLRSWGNYSEEAYQLEKLIARKPSRLQIEFVGSGAKMRAEASAPLASRTHVYVASRISSTTMEEIL